MKNFRLYITFFFFLLFFTVVVNATVITSKVLTGSFSVNTNWVGDVAPGPADEVVIAAGANITLDADVSVLKVTIYGTLNLNANLTLTIGGGTGLLIANPSGQLNANSFLITLVGTSNWDNQRYPAGFNCGTSTVKFMTGGAPVLYTQEVFYKLHIDGTGLNINLAGYSIVYVLSELILGGDIVLSGAIVQLGNASNMGSVNHANQANFVKGNGYLRWYVDPSKKTSYEFPVGEVAANGNKAIFDIYSGNPGTLDVRFYNANPAGGMNTYGYWEAIANNGLSTTSYSLRLTANGFAGTSATTAILTSDNSAAFQFLGNHKAAVVPIIYRDEIVNHAIVTGTPAGANHSRFALKQLPGAGTCPSITTHPATITPPCSGTNVNFGTIVVSNPSAMTLSYQWKKDGKNIIGSTTTSYSITGAKKHQEGAYYVEVTSECGTIRSNVSKLVLKPAPTPTFGYSHERSITISPAVGTDKTDFPVVLSIPHTAFNGKNIHAKGYDVIFIDNTNVKLDHEIEQELSGGTGNLVVWIRIPNLSALPAGTTIKMLYGNAAVIENPSTTGVWPAEYRGVWHMNSDTIYDATSNRNFGINSGTTSTPGRIANGRLYDGLSNFIRVYKNSSIEPLNLTYSLWFKPDVQLDPSAKLMYKGIHNDWPYASVGFERRNNIDGYGIHIGIRDIAGGATGDKNIPQGSLPTENGNAWHHIAGSYDGNVLILYFNGVQVNSLNIADIPRDIIYSFSDAVLYDLYFGRPQNGSMHYFKGVIDEARIVSSAKSATWIQTEYNNQLDPAVFYTLGAETKNAYHNFDVCLNVNMNYQTLGNHTGHAYLWSASNNKAGEVGGNTNNYTLRWTNTGAKTISLRDTYNGCIFNTTAFPVTVLAVPGNISTTQPTDVRKLCEGVATFYEVTTAPNPVGNYTWQYSTDGGINYTDLSNTGVYSGVNTLRLNISNVTGLDAHRFRLKAENACGVKYGSTSRGRLEVVKNAVTFLTHPVNVTKCTGATSFTASVDQASYLALQWVTSSNSGVTYSNASGGVYSNQTTQTLNISNVNNINGYYYRLRVSNATCGIVDTSIVAVLTANLTSSNILSQPATISNRCPGSNEIFRVSARGTNLIHQWQISTNNGTIWTNLNNNATYSNVNDDTLFINNIQYSSPSHRFRDSISNTCNSIKTANDRRLDVLQPITVTTQPPTRTICEGSNTTFTRGNSGSNSKYQWQKDGVNLVNGGVFSGVTTGTLTITGAQLPDAGNYRCYIYNTDYLGNLCTFAYTNYGALIVNTKSDAGFITGEDSICPGNPVTLTLNSITGGVTRWGTSVNGVSYNFSNNTSNPYTSSNLPGGQHYFKAIIKSGVCNNDTTDGFMVTVPFVQTDKYITSLNDTICQGSDATIQIENSQPDIKYQVFRYGTSTAVSPVFTGDGNNIDILIPALSLPTGLNRFTVKATAWNCVQVDMVNYAEVFVNPGPLANKVFTVNGICAGEDAKVIIQSSQPSVFYQVFIDDQHLDSTKRFLGNGQILTLTIPAIKLPLGSYNITVLASLNGCASFLNGSVNLNVSNSATTTMSVQVATACPGDVNAPIVISDSENGVSYYAVRKNTQDTVAGPVLGNNSFANILVPVNRLTPGYNELTITAKLPGGCAVNLLNVVEVNVNVAPNINYTLSAPKDTICPADVFPITMNSSQLGMLYRLYVGNDPATNDIQGSGVKMIFNTDVNILTPGDKIISVRVRPGDCPSDTINSKVKVHVLPIPDYSLTIQYPAVICPENTMDITVLNTQNNVVYQVFKDQDTIISNALTGNGANIIFNVTSDKLRDGLNNIVVKARLSKCYFAPMTQAAIVRKVITPKSSFSFLDKPFSVCPGIDFSFFLSGTETTDRAVKYFANLNNVTVTDSIVGTGGSVKFTIAAANIIPGAHKIKVYARAENCAPIQLNDSAVLTAYKNPELDRSIIGDTVCPNSDALVRILNSESNLYTYQAYIDNQIAGTSRLGNNGQIGLTIPAASLAAYSDNFTMIEVRARVSTCADLSLSQQVMVKVFKDPKINLVFSSDPVCPKSPAPYSILNTESGVNYLIYQNENLIDTVKGNGGDVIDTIPASLLSVGSNTFPVNASVRYCDIKPLIVPLVIQVKPNPSQFKDLVYKDSICPNQNAIIQVVNTEENVRYALLNKNNTSISDFINGDNTNHNFIILPQDLSEGSNLLKIEAELNLCKVILDAKPNIYVVKTPLANFKVAADYFLCPGLPGEINVSGSERDALYSLWLNSKKLSDQEGSGAGMSFSVPSDSMQVGLNIFTIRSQRSVCSSVTLTDTAGILVMMTPDKNLILTGDVLCPAQNGDIAIANSETGVTYRAYLASNNKLIGQPAIGIDGGVAYISLNANELPTFDNIIKVRATFSNCASIDLVDTALMKIRKAPELDKKLIGDSKCPTSTTARITVKETEPGVKYRAYLELSGLVLSSLMTGNGGDIILNIPIAQLNNGNNSIIITANAGCADFNLSNKANVRLSEFPLLDLGVVSDKICIGGQAAVTVLNSEAGIQYQLYRGTQPVSDIYTGTGNNIRIDINDPQSNLPVGTNNFTIIATNECNSKDLVNSANVVVDRNSVGGFALGDVEQICAGSDGGIIKLSGIVGKVLRWIGSTDTIVWTNYEIPSSVFDVPELFESQYYKAVVKSGACPADTSTMIFIKVNPAPREDLKLKGDSVCEGSSAIIALLNYEPEMTYQLRRSPADTIVKAPTRVVGQDLIFDLSNMNSTGTFFIMASSNGECGVKLPARATVFVKPNPKPVFTGDFKLGCDEIVVNYNLESLPGHYYSYSVVGGRILSQTTNQSDVKIRWEIDVTKETPHLIYLYDSIPASGCKVTNKYEVKYQDTELPVLSCPDMIHRDILRTDVDSFIRYSVVGYELDPLTMADQCGIVSITNDYNEGKSLKDSVITLPIVDEEHVYQKTIRWTISDYAGFKAYCSVKAEFRIIDEILPVTAFSPNSDGTNDTWKIKVIERYPDAIVSVYTRFGEKVFESPKGYPNEWDGTYKGMVLPPDTYHYMIQINGLMVKRGMITILTAY